MSIEIVGMLYPETRKRQGSFGYEDVPTDTRDKEFIQLCIKQGRDYQYFDKWGNEFSIDEINQDEQLTRVNKVLYNLEMDLLKSVQSDEVKRKELLPIRDKKSIYALIWNLTTSNKYRKQINLSDFNVILDRLFERFNNPLT